MGMMVFDFEDKAVRAFERDGQSWFVAADMCRCLGMPGIRDALARLPDDEKSVCSTNGHDVGEEYPCVSEPGLYRLIFSSNRSEAERLKRFVFHELLPRLRRTGPYSQAPDFETIRDKMAIVKETRLTMGKKAAAALWKDLDLPVAGAEAEPVHERDRMLGHLLDFLEECTEKDARAEVPASVLYQRYQQWAPKNSAPFMTLVGFGKLMPKAGVSKRKTNSFFYTGIRLRPSAETAAS